MVRFLRPLTRGTTYTRWLHLWVPMMFTAVWILVFPEQKWGPAVLLAPLALIPAVRVGEGVQARWLLTPGERDPGFATAPSVTWRDRLRTLVWVEVRWVLGWAAAFVTVWGPITVFELVAAAFGRVADDHPALPHVSLPQWGYGLLAPLALIALYGAVVGLGELVTVLARRLLGPSPAERMAALEERTDQLPNAPGWRASCTTR